MQRVSSSASDVVPFARVLRALALLSPLALSSCQPSVGSRVDGGSLDVDDTEAGSPLPRVDGGKVAVGGALGAPFAIRIVDVTFGGGAGFGQEALPDVVLGAPRGAASGNGSFDVLSLGVGGSVTLELGRPAVDEPGPDLLVFENPFLIGGSGRTFAEPGEVSVSEDGIAFTAFPCAPAQLPPNGCAGVAVVLANPDLGIDPTDPAVAGGDQFDLATIGAPRARFVRIVDRSLQPPNTAGTSGFDLDAVAVASHVALVDAGAVDAGIVDVGAVDAGSVVDAGVSDAGDTDAGSLVDD